MFRVKPTYTQRDLRNRPIKETNKTWKETCNRDLHTRKETHKEIYVYAKRPVEHIYKKKKTNIQKKQYKSWNN